MSRVNEERSRPPLGRLQELASSVSSVVAPITLISALLFYFGYVYSRVLYSYFGLDVDTIGLSTQEFIMRSPGPLLTPLLLTGLLGAAVAVGHSAVRRRIAAADTPARLPRFERLALASTVAGRALLAAGAALVLAYAWLRVLLPFYDALTPAVLALGAALAAYGLKLDRLLGRRAAATASLALYFVLATALLWSTATFAQLIGRGAAIDLARHLDTLPAVVLDTHERLYLISPGIDERTLPPGSDQAFHFRYRGLRLLIQGKDRLFLVPASWAPDDATLVVPLDAGIRVQFPFRG